MTKQLLNDRQRRWAMELSDYRFTIIYRPGSKNGKADILSRQIAFKSHTRKCPSQFFGEEVVGSVAASAEDSKLDSATPS